MKSIFKLILLLLFLTCCYFGYNKFFDKKEEFDYITTTLKKGDITNSVIATGEVYAQNLIDVGAQVGGQIKKLYVKLGDSVKKGDMIAQIDSVKQENEIAKQKAQLQIYNANLNSAKISAKNAKIQYQRELALLKSNATSKESVENAKNTLALDEAKVDEIKSQIEQTKIELDTANTNLGYTKITAPSDGVIVSLPVEEGKTVNSNQTTPTIAKIADLSKMEIRMQIAEGDILKISKGMSVVYSILSDNKHKFKAIIDSVDPALTTLSDGSYNNTQSSSSKTSDSEAVYYYAKVLINDNKILKIGMTTENSIIINEAKDVNYLPINAVKSDEKGDFVLILRGDKQEKRYIKTGISDNYNVEIKSGVNENDEVIISESSKKDNIVDKNKMPKRPPRM